MVGPPRSGTSVTARILHEQLGICMGHKLYPGNAGNPKGFYEDSNLVDVIKTRDVGRVLQELESNHAGCQKPVRGIKSPMLSFMNFGYLNPDVVIRTIRDRSDVARSIVKWNQPPISYADAVHLVEKYEKGIDKGIRNGDLKKVHYLDLTHQEREEDIERELRIASSPVVLAASTRGS